MNHPLTWLWLWLGVPLLLWWLARRASNAEEKIAALRDELRALRFAPDSRKPNPPTTTTAPTGTSIDASSQLFQEPVAATPPPLPSSYTWARISPDPAPTAPPSFQQPATTITKPSIPVVKIDWESFLGVKLFAWIGGLLLFLAVGFFIKWSFDRDLIGPQLRVALGYLTGAGVLTGALLLSRERFAVTVQALCGAAVLILYTNTFACHSYYHFLSATPTFAVMALITAVAFMLAVRLNAQAVAVLGLVGGFLTPVLLSTGVDRAIGLFTYVALLDIGLVAVALRQRWNYLALLAATGTAIMQLGWQAKFFAVEKFPIAATVFLGFAALFATVHALACRWKRGDQFTTIAAFGCIAVAFVLAFILLTPPWAELGRRPGLIFGFAIAADAIVLALAWSRKELRLAQYASGAVLCLLLAVWTNAHLTNDLLPWALALYLLFAVLHTIFPVVVERRSPSGQPVWMAHAFPSLALILVLLPLFKLNSGSLLIWPIVLLVDLLAIAMAVLTLSLVSIAAVLLITLGVAVAWIARMPADVSQLPDLLLVIAGFAVFFFAAGIFAGKKILPRLQQMRSGNADESPLTSSLFQASGEQSLAHLPAMSALMPFLLLIMVTLRLPIENPSPLFGIAALLTALAFVTVRFYGFPILLPMTLAGTWFLELLWNDQRFDPARPVIPLLWYLAFPAMHFIFPFLFRDRFGKQTIPWATSALAFPAHFLLIYPLVKTAWPNNYMGLLPALFAVPAIIALIGLVKHLPLDAPKRNTQLALFGGVALLFITLIFPIQFSKQWLTIAWALEGAALLWLFHRVPHVGLKWVGTALLGVAFARLALNPEVFDYQPRSGQLILNWWLYSYGIVTAGLFAAARLTLPPRDQLHGLRLPPLFQTLGTILAFLLLNIEIADAFSDGPRLQFRFSGNLAQDMTYSIGWGMFAFVLLVIGILRDRATARYAGLALLVATLVKLFLHDLWQLGGLFRIGSLIGLAVVLMVVSFIYQKFLSTKPAKKDDSP